MPASTVGIAAIVFGLILEVSAANLYLKKRPRGEILPLVIIGAIFLGAGLFRVLG